MIPDEATLIAYVDGSLNAEESARLDEMISASPELMKRVAYAQAARLPYREAFADQRLPPVPESLYRAVAAMAHPAHDSHSGADAAQDPPRGARASTMTAIGDMMRSWLTRSVYRLRAFTPRLAFGVAVASFCMGAAAGLFAGSGLFSEPSGRAAPAWIQAAADYQQLYARATLAQVRLDSSAAAQTIEAIRFEDGLALRVPDLRAVGMSLRQIQRLRFHGKPVAQLVYLPDTGQPVALCVIKQAGPDQSLKRQTVSGVEVATWRRDELAYALFATDRTVVDLASLGGRIAANGFADVAQQRTSPGASSEE
ncbi:anti-sigma factor [Paraburkholderia sp. NMBU_R16]|uniref:anti-sigma factor n=1 Tax=Paraburkholderia sp. NMBU_R16 TaxID=2698676 RepID=UPI001567C190|nr:anti-sigma factor [Paraburkholderia sp. NMBU_R16]NRO98997.1 anti-sigma factor [Paraburkholderia sp. NMBU_R16]